MRITRVGVAALKGTRHTAYDALELDARGAVGDRAFCLVDTTARKVLKTVENPSLVAVLADWDGHTLDVTLPSGERATGAPEETGETVTCDYWGRPVELALVDGPHPDLLARHVGRDVRLARAPRGEIVYGGLVSILTTASLRALAREAGVETVDPARFRSTLVVDAGDEPWLEDAWIGHDLQVGAATLHVTAPIPRCAVIDLGRAGERDTSLLTTLGRIRPGTGPHDALAFGVDARVTVAGAVRPGDSAALLRRS
ncbi:MOSC domain-containing protein [Nocardioides sp. KIGAM211]|uniref:MOSC domain-containing protein n=1 Tax=Nocardioides luti TaxID=2761101 RepID=A0A7X0RE49_9ACTN|nr:MOSC domain-containing protein [Nocardioides luti]